MFRSFRDFESVDGSRAIHRKGLLPFRFQWSYTRALRLQLVKRKSADFFLEVSLAADMVGFA